MADDFGFSSPDNGVHPVEEDPAAAFLAQQESEIAVIENDGEGFGDLEEAEQPQQEEEDSVPEVQYDAFNDEPTAVNGDMFEDSNGISDSYAAIAQVDQFRQEPESLRMWREEQKTRLEELDAASKAAEAEWKEKARKELEDWHHHQSEQLEKNKTNNRLYPSQERASEEAFLNEVGEDSPGTEWEKVARLCDFNPKTNKQSKDVSRMRSVLISLKQTPLVEADST
ncbi:clathrin light chain B isoform X1 [Clupea harengus]|uniref:Clathrin light chain n=1 Tax=Clupea harengus TaxID=7950 RepID=A0A6P8EQ01_CLUHA|nr:clathrin light chain B isoform X1 [Clupea harengus]